MELKSLLFCSSIYLFHSKVSKEIWQVVTWSENVLKENVMLQFSWLEEFRLGKVSRWWTLDKIQYENGSNDELCTYISKR